MIKMKTGRRKKQVKLFTRDYVNVELSLNVEVIFLSPKNF